VSPKALAPLPPRSYEPLLRIALAEDLGKAGGSAGDITSHAIIDAKARTIARLIARKAGRIAGLPVALAAFRMLDRKIIARCNVRDGADVSSGECLATIKGNTRALLGAERTALNLLCHLSGIATVTGQAVALARGKAKICCTRKTLPGLRALEKYAVRAGGGVNHRFGLYDAVLIKDNHVAAAGGVAEAIRRVRARLELASLGPRVKIEVEVDTLRQLDQALALNVDAVLLDNMTPLQLRRAVQRSRASGARRPVLEASGGVTLRNLARVAATGVDVISIGWLTHSAPALDIALDFD
jgi:nicotinate-nucleotide pyrophosphorylase (carboxylating)